MNTAPRADQLSKKSPKSSQRDRLIVAMTDLCARDGYRAATIADVIAAAGVSRATFYDYFTDKRDCVLAAQATHISALSARIERATAQAQQGQAMRAALAAVLGFAAEDPAATQLLTHESLAAGDDAASRYDQLLQTFGDTLASVTSARNYLVAPAILLAGIFHTIWPSLNTGETSVERFLPEFDAWIASYELPHDHYDTPRRLNTQPATSRFLPDPPLNAPKPLPPGRRVLPPGEVNRNRRERILYATAEATAELGYLGITVDDVVARAQIARRAFYQHFEDTDDAFLGVLEFFAQPLLASTAGAFFAAQTWPERIWDALLALLDFLHAYPSVAHAMFVDSFAASDQATRSIRATERALALLLEEGYQQTPTQAPPRITSELIIATVTQLANRQLRNGDAARLTEHLPQFAAVVLAPFLGAAATAQLLADKTTA